MMAGVEQPSNGEARLMPGFTAGLLDQEPELDETKTVLGNVEDGVAETKELLEKAIGELPGREREVLALYHFQELTMKQVGAMMRIGASRVSQIHTSALLRLRELLAGTLSKASPLMHASRSAASLARVRV